MSLLIDYSRFEMLYRSIGMGQAWEHGNEARMGAWE